MLISLDGVFDSPGREQTNGTPMYKETGTGCHYGVPSHWPQQRSFFGQPRDQSSCRLPLAIRGLRRVRHGGGSQSPAVVSSWRRSRQRCVRPCADVVGGHGDFAVVLNGAAGEVGIREGDFVRVADNCRDRASGGGTVNLARSDDRSDQVHDHLREQSLS